MGIAHRLAAREAAALSGAAGAYLATLSGPESAGTRRVYSGVLRALLAEFGAETAETDVSAFQPRAVAEWFSGGEGSGRRRGRTPQRCLATGAVGVIAAAGQPAPVRCRCVLAPAS